MAQLIVRSIDEDLKAGLKRQAVMHGWSMEEEIRQILRRAVQDQADTPSGLGSRIASRFSGIGLDKDLPELRGQLIAPASFDDDHS